MAMSDELRDLLCSKGADMVGVADLKSIAPDIHYDLPFGISIGVALDPHIISEIHDGPTQKYYEEYKRVNHVLNALSNYAEQFLQEQGCSTKSLAVTSAGIDPKTLSTQLPHKTVATRAGIGWIGKCALLLLSSGV